MTVRRRGLLSLPWRVCALTGALLFSLPLPALAAHPKNIMILRGESPELPASRGIVDAIQAAVRKSQAGPAEFYLDSIDAGRFAAASDYERRLANLFEEKYRDIHLDLVVALTEPAVQFVLRERNTLFARTPLLLGMIERRMIDTASLPADTAVVFLQLDIAGTVRLALRTHPSARYLTVASGSSRFDRGWLSVIREDLRPFEKAVTITYDGDSTHEDLLKHLAALPANAIVLYTSMTRDADGDPERPVDVLETLRAASPVPIYGIASTNLGHGILGGSLLDLERHGRDMGLQAARVLAGEHPAPVTTPAFTAVDWRELKRFDVASSTLEAGTVVSNREMSIWERDRKGIIIGGCIVFVESALLVALFEIARRRRQAQRLLSARVGFDTGLLELIVALASAPPERCASTLKREIDRLAPSLGIDRVRRWNFGDSPWDSPALRMSQPALLGTLPDLPPDVQRELTASGWKSGWALAIPLSGDTRVFGAMFCLCRADTPSWRAGIGELHVLGTTVTSVLERKHAEGQLEQSHTLKGSILASLPANVVVLDRDGVIIGVNRAWEQFARDNGVSSPSAIGEGANYRDVCLEGVRAGAAGAAEALAMIDAACRGESNPGTLEYRCDSDTRQRWFQMTAVPLIRPEGGAIVKHLDISDMKLTEIALRESEGRFRLMAEALPIAIWMSEVDGRCSYFNQQWLQMTGRSFEQEAGTGWLEGVHPDDRQACMDTYVHAFDRREPFSMEYRIRRYDGEYRWVLDSGTPRYGGGAFHGYVGGCVDITDRKSAERTLRDINRRLILAQEDERRRIARELHDHLSQQLALLSIDIQQIITAPPASVDALREALSAIRTYTAEIASDVHAISHRLHPSKIEALGLVPTMRAHCRDVSRHGLAVQFHDQELPHDIPADVSLCLYRVLEESISNITRHSGARQASVFVSFNGEIILRVVDKGRGFAANGTGGLGLVSMRERVEAVGGRLHVFSRPGYGTVVTARVPSPQVSTAVPQSAESA